MKRSFLFFAIAAAGCTEERPLNPAPPPFAGRVRSYFGEEVSRIVQNAERAEVQRIQPRFGLGSHAPVYQPLGAPSAVDPERTGRLKGILADSASYRWDIAKPCAPTPGVRVGFFRGADRAELLLCFECDMLSLAMPGEFRWEDFDPVRGQLVELVQELLPDDEEIRGLKKVR